MAGSILIRKATEDTVLLIRDSSNLDTTTEFPVLQGTRVSLLICADSRLLMTTKVIVDSGGIREQYLIRFIEHFSFLRF